MMILMMMMMMMSSHREDLWLEQWTSEKMQNSEFSEKSRELCDEGHDDDDNDKG